MIGLRRLTVLSSGLAGLMILAIGVSTSASGIATLIVELALLVAGALLVSIVGLWWRQLSGLPNWMKPWSAYLRYVGDLLGLLYVIALIPLTLGEFGVYSHF